MTCCESSYLFSLFHFFFFVCQLLWLFLYSTTSLALLLLFIYFYSPLTRWCNQKKNCQLTFSHRCSQRVIPLIYIYILFFYSFYLTSKAFFYGSKRRVRWFIWIKVLNLFFITHKISRIKFSCRIGESIHVTIVW